MFHSATRVASALIALVCLTAVAFSLTLMAQPSGAGSGRGKELYEKHCAECHGSSGQGDGPAAQLLMPRPRDFTGGKYKLRSTETGSIPTDDDLLRAVRQGLQGTSMPACDKLLSEVDIRAVVTYLKTLSRRFGAEAPQPVQVAPKVTERPGDIGRGAAIYEKLQCGKCHGSDGRGTGAAATSFEDDWRQPLRATDLTEPWTFRGGTAPIDVFMRFRTGMSGTPCRPSRTLQPTRRCGTWRTMCSPSSGSPPGR